MVESSGALDLLHLRDTTEREIDSIVARAVEHLVADPDRAPNLAAKVEFQR